MPRLDDLVRFYRLLETLERRIGGSRLLADCHGRMNWPQRGVYFFTEHGETRTDSGQDPSARKSDCQVRAAWQREDVMPLLRWLGPGRGIRLERNHLEGPAEHLRDLFGHQSVFAELVGSTPQATSNDLLAQQLAT